MNSFNGVLTSKLLKKIEFAPYKENYIFVPRKIG